MVRFALFWAALLFAALAVGSTQAVALASMSHDREVWNTARIDALPPELRSRVMRLERACGAPVSAAAGTPGQRARNVKERPPSVVTWVSRETIDFYRLPPMVEFRVPRGSDIQAGCRS